MFFLLQMSLGVSIKKDHSSVCLSFVCGACKRGQRKEMSGTLCRLFFLLCLGSAFLTMNGIFMGKLSSKKRCADEDCAYAISLARAEDNYNAPDCRFINIRKGQLIYVYSKLVKEKKAGEFWFGSIFSEQYEDQTGTMGYFPRSLVTEQHVFRKANRTIPTKVIDFVCE